MTIELGEEEMHPMCIKNKGTYHEKKAFYTRNRRCRTAMC
jgi:hypothetical protein